MSTLPVCAKEKNSFDDWSFGPTNNLLMLNEEVYLGCEDIFKLQDIFFFSCAVIIFVPDMSYPPNCFLHLSFTAEFSETGHPPVYGGKPALTIY